MDKMNLRESIEKIFKDNTDYTNAMQAVNQADSINALSTDLYTDANRFIYELLQNADDSCQNGKPVKVWIKIFDNTLVVAHSGKSFDANDIKGICNINNGTKKEDLSKTGYKGIGFKSVFGQSNRVIIYTDKECFRFDESYSFKWKWEETQSIWERKNDRTFQFPWQIIPVYTEINEIPKDINNFICNSGANVATIIKINHLAETTKAIQDLSNNTNMFIFLKNISEINFDTDNSVCITIDRTKSTRVVLQKNKLPKTEWLIKKIDLEVSESIKLELQDERNMPDKLLVAKKIELSLATQINDSGIVSLEAKDKLLYSYLPTSETKYSFPVLVNTSFLTSANRETIHKDSKWNQWLFESIAFEIFRWISELVVTEISFEAYRLLPKDTFSDELGNKFNAGIQKALKDIPFILSRDNKLIKVEESIIDFTYLSEKEFIGEEPIKSFVSKTIPAGTPKKFVKDCKFITKFKERGTVCFEWSDIKSFLTSSYFKDTHTIKNNIELIKHFKKLCDSDNPKNISEEVLRTLPFVWNHKNYISYPNQVCFPTSNDKNWDNQRSDLDFVHPDILNWILQYPKIKNWLEILGVKEKTDITYIFQTIIPNIENYITEVNSITEIQKLFLLYKKGDLQENVIKQMTQIKLLTINNSLCPASNCYLSDFYNPRLKIENIFKQDIFVSEKYCMNSLDKDEWKRFFKMLGVHEGINTIQYKQKYSKLNLIGIGLDKQYFLTADMQFQPYMRMFIADEFSNITILKFIKDTVRNNKFALGFWRDYIENHQPSEILEGATAYWGNYSMPGRNSGDIVGNYIPWFVKNIQCIPTLAGRTEVSSSVFLNTDEIKNIAGKYLPVFHGSELSADWKSFFQFKTNLELTDCLRILSEVSIDVDDTGHIKDENIKRVQSIYSILLSQCANWSTEELLKVEGWVETGLLLSTKNEFIKCSSLKYFLDGNEGIFQNQYNFVIISAENKMNLNLLKFLEYFKVSVLRQSEFKLISVQKELCSTLKKKLELIYRYFECWIKSETQDADTLTSLVNLKNKIEKLKIYQADSLSITYNGIDFTKEVNVHFDEDSLYVTTPWGSNSALLKLPEVLSRYFDLIGHDKKLDFLLRSTGDEIQKYFEQENIQVSPENLIVISDDFNNVVENTNALVDCGVKSNQNTLSQDFFDTTIHDFSRQQYIKKLIPRAVDNVLEHLSALPEYDCSCSYIIAESIIGGITKNGNEITVVARPSDYDKIRLHYDAEFDVLEYVDAELWYEDGITPPKQFTLGQLLKMTGINKIPIKNINIKDSELDTLLNNPRSNALDYNAVPYSPEKTARIISSFANTDGGTLIFGIKEISSRDNEIVGLSSEFKVIEITKKAISMLSPIPIVTFDWVNSSEKSIFVIKTAKSDSSILLNEQKYIRESSITKLDEVSINRKSILNIPNCKRTIVIIVAIENYYPKQRNQIPLVKYAERDAEKFKEVLLNKLDINEGDIYILKNEQAIKTEVEDVVKYQIFSMSEEDRLIFYYVGHGFHNGVTNYLSTYDMSQYDISNTAISLRKLLLDPLKQSKCKNALIFIDACAQSFIDENSRSSLSNINDEELLIFSNDFPYYALFLSCQTGEKSYSCDNLKNGIWTYYLIEAISGCAFEAIKENKYITDRTLGDYLSQTVSQYVKSKLGFDQNPKAILDATYENVVSEIKNYYSN